MPKLWILCRSGIRRPSVRCQKTSGVGLDRNGNDITLSTVRSRGQKSRHRYYFLLFVKQIVNIVEGPKLINIIHEVVYVWCMFSTPFQAPCDHHVYIKMIKMDGLGLADHEHWGIEHKIYPTSIGLFRNVERKSEAQVLPRGRCFFAFNCAITK